MKEGESKEVGSLLARALFERSDEAALADVRKRVAEIAEAFPPYPPDFPGHV
jgi:glycine/serine hydroxymethyltransferase